MRIPWLLAQCALLSLLVLPAVSAPATAPSGSAQTPKKKVEPIRPGHVEIHREPISKDDPLHSGLSGVGAINSFTVPAGWELSSHSERARGYSYDWRSKKHPEVTIWIAWDGQREDAFHGKGIQALLDLPPHKLNPDEIKRLKRVIDPFGDSKLFKVTLAEAKNVGGTGIFVISGRYADGDIGDNIFINSGGDGTIFQHVGYRVPAKLSDAYRKEVQKAFDSLSLRSR